MQMKVKELIEELKKYDWDLDVLVDTLHTTDCDIEYVKSVYRDEYVDEDRDIDTDWTIKSRSDWIVISAN